MKEQYLKVLEDYDVKSLYHFTSLSNIDSILLYGICNRLYMDNNNINYIYTDKDRLDNQRGCISLSLNNINKAMFSYKQNRINTIWIIIEIDAYKLISNFYNSMYFCKYNASSPSVIELLNNNKVFLKSDKAFRNMFDTTGKVNNQAEILFEGNITCDYINNIYVDSLQSKMVVSSLLSEHNYNNINVVIKREMF